jgi:hypothetical protein
MEYYCSNCTKNVRVIDAPAGGGKHCRECGNPILDDSIAPGSIVAGFKIIHEIARSSNGIVYLARQATLDRDVALKILPEEKAADAAFIDCFFHEARAAAALTHPAIVQAYDAGVTTDGIYYFAMELIDGETAESILEQRIGFTPEQVINIAVAIAEALEYAWERQQLTHGDIKPENIVFNRHGEAKLADLGLAKIAFDQSNETEIMATPLYAAPEVIRGEKEKIGVKTDIYAFGIVLYQMFCGRPPFDEEDPVKVMEMHLQETHISLKNIGSEFQHLHIISDFIDRMIAKEPGSRPESWNEVVGFLKMMKANKRLYEPLPERRGAGALFRAYPLASYSILAISLLLVAVGATYLVRGKSGGKPPLKNPAQVKIVQPAPGTEEKWTNLKNSLKYMRSAEAVTAINQFIAGCGQNVLPSDTELLLQQYSGQAADDAARAAAALAARAAVTDEIRSIEQEFAEIRKLSDKHFKMQDTLNRIDAVLLQYQSGEIPENCFSPAAIKRFNEEHKNLAQQLAVFYKSSRSERVAAVIDAMRRESKLKPAVQNAAILHGNAEYNYYFALINEFMELPESKRTNLYFQKITEGYGAKIKSQELKQKILFLQGVLPDENSAAQLLQRFSPAMQGKELPWLLNDKKFTLVSCDSSAMTLIHQISDGVEERKKLTWQNISLPQQALLLQRWIIDSNIAIPADDFYILGGMMLTQKQSAGMHALLKRFADTNGINLEQWRSCFRDFSAAAQECAARTVAEKIIALEQKDEISAAYLEYLYKFNQFRQTVTFNRYQPAFTAIFEPFLRSQPEAGAETIAAVLINMPDKDLYGALNKSCAAYELYASLKSVPAAAREKLNKIRSQTLNNWSKNSDVNRISLHPGIFWRIAQPMNPPDGSLLQTAAAMNIGDMAVVSKNIKDKNILDSVNQYKPEWQYPQLYYAAIAAKMFEQYQVRDGAIALLRRQAAKKNIAAFCWTMQTALACREINLAAGLQNDFTVSAQPGKLELRAALLCLIAELQRHSCHSKRFATLVNRYRNSLQTQLTVNEIKWLNVINSIINNQDDINPELDSLPGTVPKEAELFAQLLADAAARRAVMLNDIKLETVVKIIELLPGVNDSTELWYRLQLLKFSMPGVTAKTLERLTEAASRDYRIAAVQYYPRIILLNAAASLLSKALTVNDTAAVIHRFLDFAPMRVPSDEKIINLLDGTKLPERFQETVAKFEMNESFLFGGCLIAAMTAVNGQFGESTTIINQMELGQPSLIWQERLLLRTVSDIIDAHRQFYSAK